MSSNTRFLHKSEDILELLCLDFAKPKKKTTVNVLLEGVVCVTVIITVYPFTPISASLDLNVLTSGAYFRHFLKPKDIVNALRHTDGHFVLQSIYVTRDRVILKFEARVQIYMAVLNICCEIQNSGRNVVRFSKINSYEISFWLVLF